MRLFRRPLPETTPVEVEAVEAPKPLDPKAAMEAGFGRVMASFTKDRASASTLIAMMRFRYPDKTKSLSDGQIIAFAEAVYREQMIRSTDNAFRATGRERELQVKTAAI